MIDPIRVVFYTDGRTRGGAQAHLRYLLAELPQHVEATLLGADACVLDWLAAARPGTGTVVVAQPRTALAAARAVFTYRRELARLQPHVVQVSLRRSASARPVVLAAASLRRVRIVAVLHSWPNGQPRRRRPGVGLVLPPLDAVVAVSERQAAALRERPYEWRGPLRVIPHGVPRSPRSRPANSVPVVGTVARLVRGKGVDVLLRAARDVPNVNVVVVGDGPARPDLEQLTADLGLRDRVSFTGWSDRVPELLREFDVFALASHMEAAGLAILEAMQAGLPVVATRVGGIPEIVLEGASGLLVPFDDPPALAEAIRALAGDDARRVRIGSAARARAQALYSSDRMARDYAALLDDMCDGRRNGNGA